MKTVSVIKWEKGEIFPDVLLVKNVGIVHYERFDNFRNKMRVFYRHNGSDKCLMFTAKQLLNLRYGWETHRMENARLSVIGDALTIYTK